MDSRPDTSDIPQRASASAGSNTPVPTSTPTKFTASYEVEDSAKGTLTGNGQTDVSSIEIQPTPAQASTSRQWPRRGFCVLQVERQRPHRDPI